MYYLPPMPFCQTSYINQPALLLSYPEQGGYLTMMDIFGLQMNADLVVLSTANTGRGENIKGEGVQKEKRHLAEALRQAKMAMIEGDVENDFKDIYYHPYFWGGFVVFGEGRPR